MAKLYYVADLLFEDPSNPITVGDSKFRVIVPYDGEILGSRNGPRIAGHIQQAGSGAGTATQIQIRNVGGGRDYFTTEPELRVDSADVNGRAVLEGGVLCLQPTFRQGDELALDVDGLPGGADSAYAQVWLTCGFWREVE